LVLDFDTVSREFRSVIARRREQLLFLGSLFAAMSLFLQNVLDGKLPDSLKLLEENAFLLHSVMMLAPTVLIALRIGKMHAGLTINGVFYRRALRLIDAHEGSDDRLRNAGRLNLFGVSSMQYLLAALFAGGEAMLLALALKAPGWSAPGIGAGVFLLLVLVFLRWHSNAARFALRAVENCTVEPFTREDDERHLAESRNDANHDLNACVGFVGLMLFASLEGISGVSDIAVANPGFAAIAAMRFGPLVYDLVLLATCLVNILIYCRLSAAVAEFSLRLDPTDTPYRPFKLTDTLLGYLLIVFFTAVAVHLTTHAYLTHDPRLVWIVDGAAAFAALVFYPLRLIWEQRKRRRRAAISAPARTPPSPPPPAA
jgi:hypothetical protein